MFENNSITNLFCIDYPIFQGGMAWVANASLAAAVSEAGGLGIIAAMSSNGNQLREEIKKARKLTKRNIGVNIMLMSPHADEVAKVVIEENIKVVTTGAGDPTKYMKEWLENGIKVVPLVASVAYAKMMERAGACAVVAEGSEAGGHIGETTTMCLVPQIVDAVKIPVIAAGGIADGRGVAASFMLGASGVQIGTRFLACKECEISIQYKNLVLKANDIQTVVTGKKLGHPVRSLKTKLTRRYIELEKTGASDEELESLTVGSLRRAVLEGDLDSGTFPAGQCVGLVKEELPAKEILNKIISQAEELLNKGNLCLK